MVIDLKYQWLWTVAIAMICGFLGAKRTENVAFEDWLA